ncbi:MAG: cell division protein FtsA [Gammaproteobacteria bacterium]|nr:MAG: cell division protein FtsA [Gammaproteobacteria bacterium]
MKKKPIVAAIDIGSSHIIAALAHISDEGDIVPVAFAEMPSKGVKKGGIVNIPLVQHVISMILDELQRDGSYHIHSIVTALSGVSIMGHNADGVIDIRGNAITEHNIKQVVAVARDMSVLEGRQLLHILRQNFIVDRQSEIENPIGLMGEKLGIRVHVISAAKAAYYNLLQSFSHFDIDVDDVVAAGFASALAVTTPDEKQLGICVLDIGAGTTDITIIHNGVVKHTEVIPLGGELISSDVAFFMRTTLDNAEAVKKVIHINKYYSDDDMVEMPGLSEISRRFSKNDIANVMNERCNELIEIVMQKITRAGFEENFPGGFVICGGSAKLHGFSELIMEKTQLPVRCAEIEIALESATYKGSHYATIMGLFMCAYEEDYTRIMTAEHKTGIILRINKVFSSWLGRLRGQF